MNIEELDTRKLLYDVSKPGEITRLQKDVPIFGVSIEGLSKKGVATYVVLMYDLESPLRKEYAKLRERKALALQYAGFTIGSRGRFKEKVEQMTVGRVPEVNAMVVKYLLLFNNPDVAALAAYKELLEKRVAKALEEGGDKDDKTTFDLIEKLRTVLHELNKNIFGGQDDEALIKELYRNIETVKEKTQPEYVAQILKRGDDLAYNPYEDWKPEPLRLIPQEEQVFKANDDQ